MDKKRKHDAGMLLVFTFMGFIWFALRLYRGELRVPDMETLFIFILLSPIAEELFFRGVLQDILLRKIHYTLAGLSLANIIVSLCFALFHISFWGYVHSGLVFIPSLIFGFLYDRTGKLTYPIILHAIYNLNIFIV
jgi:hypothetical protein